jgi:hypothetical protein
LDLVALLLDDELSELFELEAFESVEELLDFDSLDFDSVGLDSEDFESDDFTSDFSDFESDFDSPLLSPP